MGESCKNTLVPTVQRTEVDAYRSVCVPESLIMRRCECFYCGVKDHSSVLIEYSFGIKVCKIHRQRGERDCRAYLHRSNFVRIEDAMKIPALKAFLDILEAHPHVTVERTNGLLENDWSFRKGNHFEPAFFSKSAEQRWGVPLYCKRINMNKTAPIINFLRPEINAGMTLPENWSSIIEAAIDTLAAGVYQSDAEAYDYARNHDDSETITETAGVAGIIYNGREERIFVGHLIDEGEQALTQSRPCETHSSGTEEVGDPSRECQ